MFEQLHHCLECQTTEKALVTSVLCVGTHVNPLQSGVYIRTPLRHYPST